MVSFDYKMIVLKMLRKMPDEHIYVINTEHPNSGKFIEAIKELIDQQWIWRFKKPFDLTFNTAMNKVQKNKIWRPSIFQSYFDLKAVNDKAIQDHRSSASQHKYEFVVVGKDETYKKKLFNR